MCLSYREFLAYGEMTDSLFVCSDLVRSASMSILRPTQGFRPLHYHKARSLLYTQPYRMSDDHYHPFQKGTWLLSCTSGRSPPSQHFLPWRLLIFPAGALLFLVSSCPFRFPCPLLGMAQQLGVHGMPSPAQGSICREVESTEICQESFSLRNPTL